MYVEMRDKAHV